MGLWGQQWGPLWGWGHEDIEWDEMIEGDGDTVEDGAMQGPRAMGDTPADMGDIFPMEDQGTGTPGGD